MDNETKEEIHNFKEKNDKGYFSRTLPLLIGKNKEDNKKYAKFLKELLT